MAPLTVHIRRVYDEPERADGARILVDRVWPRGVRKDELNYHEWIKDVAPSKELRTWFGHDPDKFAEFRRRYRAELRGDTGRAAVDRLRKAAKGNVLTLLTATKDVEHSHAAVLEELLRDS